LRVSWCGTPSLTRGWVCNLLEQLLLGLARAVTPGPSPAKLATIVYCLIETPPTWRARSPYLCPPRNKVAQLYPRALGSLFVSSYDSQGCGGGILTHLHTRFWTSNSYTSQSQSYLTTDSQSASLSWCQATIRTRDQFFFLLEIFLSQLRICYFMAPSLTRGWVCNLLLLLGNVSAVPLGSESHGTQDHILLSKFFRHPNMEGQVSVFISPRDRVVQSKVKVKVKSRSPITTGQSVSMSWCLVNRTMECNVEFGYQPAGNTVVAYELPWKRVTECCDYTELCMALFATSRLQFP
jgi:hypothetical protein